MALMHPHRQIFGYPGSAVRLRGAVRVYLAVIDTPLEAHPRQHLIKELSQASIQGVLTQESLCQDSEVQILDKDDFGLVTKLMGQLELPVKTTSGYLFVYPSNLLNQLASVIRALLLILQPALQQFKLALQLIKKARTLNLQTIGCRQEIFKPHINANAVTARDSIRHVDIGLKAQGSIPPRMLLDNAYHEPVRDRAVQNDWHQANFGQLDVIVDDRTTLELREQERAILSKLLKRGKPWPRCALEAKAASTRLNWFLQNLRLNVFEPVVFFLGCCQRILLLIVARGGNISSHDVFRLYRASVYQTLARANPILTLTQGVYVFQL